MACRPTKYETIIIDEKCLTISVMSDINLLLINTSINKIKFYTFHNYKIAMNKCILS